MNINLFISQRNILPADAIVLTKKFFGMLDHYVIYLGMQNLEHRFVANYVDGVKVIPNREINSLLEVYVPTNIEKFPGKHQDRHAAIKRAVSRIGEKAYGIVSNNCEHFKNYVHYGVEASSQVEKFGVAGAIGGAGLLLVGMGKKSNAAIIWGIVIIIVGILIAAFATREGSNCIQKK
jgi:hypothetical protein